MKYKLVLILLIIFSSVCCAVAAPIFKFTVKVIDSHGNPIADADVFANFTGSKAKVVEGKTNKKGLFTASGATTPICGVTVEKEGYYMSGYSFEPMLVKGETSFGRWQPWNPTIEVVLKEKRNPIPMYVFGGGAYMRLPIFDQPVGYDLEKKDWVTPYGEGRVKDFVFVFSVSDKNAKPWDKKWSCSYRLTFSNEKDGILEYYPPKDNKSEYIWPYEAPETGYKTKLTGFDSIADGHVSTNYDEKRSYIFRVRTKVDKQGNIVESRYGKIKGDIRIDTEAISFSYYFNPTGTRNLEFSGENLFTSDKNKYPY